MTRVYDIKDPVMVYNASNQWTLVEAADIDKALASGWLKEPAGDIYTAPSEYPGTIEFTEEAPSDPLAAMTKAQLMKHAAANGVEVTDKMTKAQLIETINAKESTDGSPA